MIEPQSPESAFADALRKGHGRAMILLRQAPDDTTMFAKLLHACRVNVAFDRQCEGSRAQYLYRLIQTAGRARAVWDELLPLLVTAREEEADHYSTAQVYDLLCRLAAADRMLPRDPLHEFVLAGQADEIAVWCMAPLVRLEGIAALLACFARSDTQSVLDDAWAYALLPEELAERDGDGPAAEALQKARASDPTFDQRLTAAQQAVEPRPPEEIEHTYAAVKSRIDSEQWVPPSWRDWATPHDLAAAATDLLAESDEKKSLRYLRLFWWRDFPGEPRSLFHLLSSPNRRIPHTTVSVLSRLQHPDVRTLALDLIRRGEHPEWGVRLMASNYRNDDFTLIESLLEESKTEPAPYHSLVLPLLGLLDRTDVGPEQRRRTLTHIYEHSPCSLCRCSAVERLVAAKELPDWMAEECRFDAWDETAELVAA